MPGYKTHIAGGAVFGAGAVFAAVTFLDAPFAPQTMALLVGVATVAALLPDIDTDSKGQNLFYGLLIAFDCWLLAKGEYRWAALVGLMAMLPAVGHHRGWTHTWWAAGLLPLPIVIIPHFLFGLPMEAMIPFYLAAVVGIVSHLILDRQF
jgi:membrane-bound metal-dependent hydrolase YbcI (DUF457 family)